MGSTPTTCTKEDMDMASQNKKNKAKNSYLRNGNEAQHIHKMKRVAYYIKADRARSKKEIEVASWNENRHESVENLNNMRL